MVEIIALILQILLIFLSLAIVLHKENVSLVIMIASFGLVAATLYILNQAPDVAIAEVAISSAIIPLIYVITISRQREFIVMYNVSSELNHLDVQKAEIIEILSEFTKQNNLKLNIFFDKPRGIEEHITVVNVDLLIYYSEKLNKFELIGKSTSILITKLNEIITDCPYIDMVTEEEGESYD